MPTCFDLFLFSTQPGYVADAVTAGVTGIVVDWERDGKWQRQVGFDTQIGTDTPEDLARVRAATDASIVCRINGFGSQTRTEVEAALANGADEILLPMVRTPSEVEHSLRYVNGRCGLGILVETREAVACATDLATLPLSRVFVGLNDLAIGRADSNIFAPVAEGTLDTLRHAFGSIPFGFGGLTLPDRGQPIPCRLLIAEMVRLECAFSFLRRSFLADVQQRDLPQAVARVHAAVCGARERSAAAIASDRDDLVLAILGERIRVA